VGKVHQEIDEKLARWVGEQRLFFVATAPLSGDGHVNCSPKGGDTLRILGPRQLAWLDGAGSGIETVAHLRENGRIVVMLCAFEGSPRIVRFHGRGEIVDPTDARFPALLAAFPPYPSTRSVILVDVTRISDSCGYGVPFYEYLGERDDSASYVAKATDRTIRNYLVKNNQRSIDGLPGLERAALSRTVINRREGTHTASRAPDRATPRAPKKPS
jgi:hypothetical protein